jgi:two-component system chemotaxis response regulator CheY
MLGWLQRLLIGNSGYAMQSSTRPLAAAIKSARVLIIDDEFYMRKAIRRQLLSLGVTDVHDALDGASGLISIGELNPDVVLLDWQMADMSGPEFVGQLRSPDAFAFPSVPLIMLVGQGEQSLAIKAMRLGVHAFLVKPVSRQALYERLASVMRNPRPMRRRAKSVGSRTPQRHPPDFQDLARPGGPGAQASDKPEVDWSTADVVFVD